MRSSIVLFAFYLYAFFLFCFVLCCVFFLGDCRYFRVGLRKRHVSLLSSSCRNHINFPNWCVINTVDTLWHVSASCQYRDRDVLSSAHLISLLFHVSRLQAPACPLSLFEAYYIKMLHCVWKKKSFGDKLFGLKKKKKKQKKKKWAENAVWEERKGVRERNGC